MKTGTDRSQPGYDGGTRHPCPFCTWYLDAEPILDVLKIQPDLPIMDAISRRLSEIHCKILEHMGIEHPREYRESTPLRVDITG